MAICTGLINTGHGQCSDSDTLNQLADTFQSLATATTFCWHLMYLKCQIVLAKLFVTKSRG